ncbi:DNA-processing protein DprA [Bifidobacterium choloepi]|uniref:DNA-processing protein DprA n=1 Tax=Bifidobacterium choloepi TaxID=2614131 RepID=A0A6I5N3T9_9BIFI|nr:DNA-processing protein DprA [Bifidobacterium choloepi]NEG70339.1 DNA-processing protein DprA [Bifidobacterium choloepi]
MDQRTLRDENVALLALLQGYGKNRSWSALAGECLLEGSAMSVLNRYANPQRSDTEPIFQPSLFDDDAPTEPVNLTDMLNTAARQWNEWQQQGLQAVTIFDDDYPTPIRSVIDAPPLLFYRGTLRQDDPGVSVVGSRNCTPEGMAFARETARLLVSRGLTVIAGLAKGIDTFAHQTALQEGGRTVAFIGTGIDRYYPKTNQELQDEIADKGLVLSQFLPGSPATRFSFPMRNALISGYGIASVIVEASERSGTRIQARQAMRHGRPIILRDAVVENTKWAKEYVGKPGVFVVSSPAEVGRTLDTLEQSEQYLDNVINQLLPDGAVR